MYIYIHTHTYIYISIVCHSLSNCLSPPPLLVLRPFLNTTERRDILAQNWGSSDYPLQCPWQPIHIWARASARAGRWCFKSSVEGWAPWELAASLSSLPGVPRSRGEGGIEPLHVSMPRGLKPRPSTSPTHHRLWADLSWKHTRIRCPKYIFFFWLMKVRQMPAHFDEPVHVPIGSPGRSLHCHGYPGP